MPAPALLIPNLGAEEGPGWRERVARAPLCWPARLWRSLFPRGARLPDFLPALAWPEGLPASDEPALAWLEPSQPSFAWLLDAEACAIATAHGAPLCDERIGAVRHCHDKAFAARFAAARGLEPACWRGLCAIFEPEELRQGARSQRAVLERVAAWPAWTRGRFALKPRFGSSARGRASGQLAAPADTWSGALPRLAARGGAVLEPWVARDSDCAAELFVDAKGEVSLLATLAHESNPAGAPRAHSGRLGAGGRVRAASGFDAELESAALAIARAAADAGFRGPCGVDAFSFRGPGGARVLRPIVELNARFTLGHVVQGVLARALPALGAALPDSAAFRVGPPPAAPAPAAAARLRVDLFTPAESAAGAPCLELWDPAFAAEPQSRQGPTSIESGSSWA